MIRRIQIDNFKSLAGFSLPPYPQSLAKFTCLIGQNGSGKTSVLQMLDFLCYFMRGKPNEWASDRGWGDVRLSSSFDSSPLGLFNASITVQVGSQDEVKWTVNYNELATEEVVETVLVNNRQLLKSENHDIDIEKNPGDFRRLSGLSFSGSSLSVLYTGTLESSLLSLKNLFTQKFITFEMVSPESLKKKSTLNGDIGRHGENLAAYFAGLGVDIQSQIDKRMCEFYPNLKRIYADKDTLSKSYEQYAIERFLREPVPASQFSDGFTRILAIVTQVESSNDPDRVLLIDQIEDGIHPELIEKLVHYLVEAPIQVIVTTHSPLILNYLSDDQAKESALFLYRNSEGKTRSCRYFDLPSTKKKLGILGPGEVYVDTSVEKLALEAEEIERGAAAGTGATGQ